MLLKINNGNKYSVCILLTIIFISLIYTIMTATRILSPFGAVVPALQKYNQDTDHRQVDTIEFKKDEEDVTSFGADEHDSTAEQFVRSVIGSSFKQTSGFNATKSSNWSLLLIVNDAFFDFYLNWFWYYKKLDINLPITIIADDDEVYKKLISTCNYCSVLRSDLDVKESQYYGGQQYKLLVSMRPKHILRMLKSGTDVIYADIDSVWLQNPLPFLNTGVDIAAQRESPTKLCTGFMAIKSNAHTIGLIQQWHDLLVKSPQVNQGPFNKLLQLNNRTVSYVALNPLYFPSGKQYFDMFSDDQRSKAVVVHNNWIVGHDSKTRRFQRFNLWHV